MKNLWSDEAAQALQGDDLALRVYSSRLLGQEDALVLHGGGNTSVKSSEVNFFGDEIETLYIKGSGWDLKTIEKAGFSPVNHDHGARESGLAPMQSSRREQAGLSRALRNFRKRLEGGHDLTGRHQAGSFI